MREREREREREKLKEAEEIAQCEWSSPEEMKYIAAQENVRLKASLCYVSSLEKTG
jgi:hypothetical protein